MPELTPAEVTICRKIPVTTPARTLLDLAACASPRGLEQALAQALRRHLVSRSKVLSLIARYPAAARHADAA